MAKLELKDLDDLVNETRKALIEADDIYIKAKKNREKAEENYTRALTLRSVFVEREINKKINIL